MRLENARPPRGPSRAITGRHGPSWAIAGHRGPSRAIIGHHGPSRAITGHYGPSGAIMGRHAPSWAMMGHGMGQAMGPWGLLWDGATLFTKQKQQIRVRDSVENNFAWGPWGIPAYTELFGCMAPMLGCFSCSFFVDPWIPSGTPRKFKPKFFVRCTLHLWWVVGRGYHSGHLHHSTLKKRPLWLPVFIFNRHTF